MNKDQLMQALGNVDEDLLAEAESYASGSTAARRKKWVTVLVAVLGVLVLAVGAGIAIKASGVTLTRVAVDHNDPDWADLLEDAPYANEMQYAEWAPQDNRMTAEIKAQLEEIEEEGEEWSQRQFSSVSELEDAYGIKLLKLGEDECNVQAILAFLKEKDHAAGGAHLLGWWNAWEDGVYLHESASYIAGNSEVQNSLGIPLTKFEEECEYEIQSLGVTAKLISATIQGEREIEAFFSYEGIDYDITAFSGFASAYQTVTIEWLCEKLETLQK